MAVILMLASGIAGLALAAFARIVLETGLLAALGLWSLGGSAVFAAGLALSLLPPRGRPPLTGPQPV